MPTNPTTAELREMLAKATPSLGLPMRVVPDPGTYCDECGESSSLGDWMLARQDGPGVTVVLTDNREEAIAALIVALANNAEWLLDAADERDRLTEGLHETFDGEFSAALEDEHCLPVDVAFECFDQLLKARAELATLRARVSELEEALRPFAEWVPHGVLPDEPDDTVWEYSGETTEDGKEIEHYRITVGDYRRAAAALKGSPDV